MISPVAKTLAALSTQCPTLQAAVLAFPGAGGVMAPHVVGGTSLPPGYKPSEKGPILLVATRGGDQEFHGKLFTVPMQILIYAPRDQDCDALARALYDDFDEKSTSAIPFARMDTLHQLLRDDQSDWPMALCFYTVHLRNA